jgi:hypothetical protein
MKIVKITNNYPDFKEKLFRQLPGGIDGPRVWDDYYFTTDDEIQECDYWIIFTNYKFQNTRVKCPKENIYFIVFEPLPHSEKFNYEFIRQFGKFYTVQSQYGKIPNVIVTHNPNPWFLNKSYDELKALEIPNKNKLISIVSSNKNSSVGHSSRLDFSIELKKYFGDNIDLYGRGINDFENKEDVLLEYKYHIAIENSYYDHYYTEKLTDPMLTYTMPIYYGCPNLDDYFNSKAFGRININDVESSKKLIKNLLDDNFTQGYSEFLKVISKEREKILDEYQFFPFLVGEMESSEYIRSNKINKIRNLKSINNQSLKQYIRDIYDKITFRLWD